VKGKKEFFWLEEDNDEIYFLLFASGGGGDGSPRAKFHINMGKDVAILASKAIANSFDLPFFESYQEGVN
jgi:hypothetical protein